MDEGRTDEVRTVNLMMHLVMFNDVSFRSLKLAINDASFWLVKSALNDASVTLRNSHRT